MAGTFGQFYVHVIFTPKHRANVIREEFREEYLKILRRCEVDFKEEYLFEWILD